MNPIRTIRRLATTLTGLAAALAAAVAGAPAAFAQPGPPPGPPAEVVRFGPVAHTFNGVTGDMTGWQIALIAVGAAILGAIVAVLLDRARAARGHRPATAAATAAASPVSVVARRRMVRMGFMTISFGCLVCDG